MSDAVEEGDIGLARNATFNRALSIFTLLLIPAFLIAIMVIYVAGWKMVWNPPGILPLLNVTFLSSVSFLISILAARSYLYNRSLAVLMLGCGTLSLGLGAALVIISSLNASANEVASIYNTCACLAGLFHLMSASLLSSKRARSPKVGLARLVAFYLVTMVAVFVISVLVLGHQWPVYFEPGEGQTAIGLSVLYLTIAMFTISAILLWIIRKDEVGGFLHYYAVGLAMISVGLLGVSMQTNMGDPLNWTGRLSQYLGTVLMLLAVFSSVRRSGIWLLPLERALQETEGKYQSLVTLSPDAILVLNEGRLVYVNPAGIKLFGAVSAEDLIGKDVDVLVHKDWRHRTELNIRQLEEGTSTPPFESRFLRLDGVPVEVEITGTNVEHENMPSVLAFVRDISERKKVEEALVESEAKYRNLFVNLQEAISLKKMVYDERGELVDLILLDANPALMSILRASTREEVRGKRYSEFYSADMMEWQLDHIRNLVVSGNTITEEAYFKNVDRYYMTTSLLLGNDLVLTNGVDITERKRTEAALQKSENRLVNAQRIAHLGSWEWNIRTGECQWSAELFSIYGLDPKTFCPTIEAFANLIHPEDKGLVDREIEKILTQGMSVSFDFRIITANGSIRILNTTGEIAKYDEEGKPLLMVGTNLDITDRKRVEDEVRRSNAELQQFAYIASHDLQEPLRMVVSYLTLLESKYQDQLDAKANEYIHFAVEGGRRMHELIDDLLTFSRVETRGKAFALVNMNDLVADTIQVLKLQIDEGKAQVIVKNLPTIMADPSQLSQLMQNLINNAIKFRKDDAPIVEISARQNAGEFIFLVKDNGIGIDPKYQDKLFQMFQRLHSRQEYEGTGIGLAISKKIVERHGGRIWYESDGKNGSTFLFTISKDLVDN